MSLRGGADTAVCVSHLLASLQSVANLLRARAQSIRDNARAVLVSMMAELGPSYLPYACHVLRASLPDRGYTAHVLGYTLHAVLEAVVKVAHGESAAAAAAAALAEPTDGGDATVVSTGYDIDDDNDEKPVDAGGLAEGGENEEEQGCVVLDESLELCLPMIEADLFGEVSCCCCQKIMKLDLHTIIVFEQDFGCDDR